MTKRISYESFAIAPWLLRNREKAFGPGAEGLIKDGVGIGHVHVDSEAGATQSFGRAVATRIVGILVRKKNQRVADSHLRMCDPSVGTRNPKNFLRSKSLLVEIERTSTIAYRETPKQYLTG